MSAYATLLAHAAWPLRGRAAAPLLALRAALPAAAAATGGAWWLHTPRAGVALQLAACVAAAAAVRARERAARPQYEAGVARWRDACAAHGGASPQARAAAAALRGEAPPPPLLPPPLPSPPPARKAAKQA
jgi:hypothetical protein